MSPRANGMYGKKETTSPVVFPAYAGRTKDSDEFVIDPIGLTTENGVGNTEPFIADNSILNAGSFNLTPYLGMIVPAELGTTMRIVEFD